MKKLMTLIRPKSKDKSAPALDDLEELGFKKAAKESKKKMTTRRKLMIAYEFYRVATPECIERFNKELKEKSEKIFRNGKQVSSIDTSTYQQVKYDRLRMRKIEEYPEAPPAHVLTSLRTAKERKCFDRFQVCDIEAVEKREDPILFGEIDGCPDLFFIDQWDDDVKFEDIVKENEG